MKSASTSSQGLLTLAAIALILAGCGREYSDETTANKSGATTPTETTAEPLAPPEAAGSIEDATDELAKSIESKDCDDVNEFNLSSRLVEDETERCDTLTTLFGGNEVLESEEFPGGAIVDYEYGEYGVSAVFVVEGDGRYHLALADNLLDGKSVGTPPASEFDRTAQDAFDALAESDCPAFLEVAHPRHGRGAVEEDAACAYVEGNPVPTYIEAYPDLAPELLDANSDYALYEVSTPSAAMVMVLGRAEDPEAGLSEAYEPLPRGAPEFGFVDLIATDPAKLPEG